MIINAGRTTSYTLNSGVTELTKFLHNIQKSLLINLLQSKLRRSNSFHNASVMNVGVGRLSICHRVEAKIPRTPFLNSEITGQMFTKFLLNVVESLPFDLFQAA